MRAFLRGFADFWRAFNRGVDKGIQDFNAWADDLDRRTKAGEFGKWPWQK